MLPEDVACLLVETDHRPSDLREQGIAFDEVDIEHDPAAAEYVMSVNGGNQTVPTATVRLKKVGWEGKDAASHQDASIGDGPVDAIFNAIRTLVPHEAKLELYQVHAVTEGTDAQAEVSVRLSEDGRSVTAKGAAPPPR